MGKAFHLSRYQSVGIAESAAARTPDGLPREAMQLAKCPSQWQSIQCNQKTPAFKPDGQQPEKVTEQQSGNQAQQSGVDPIIDRSFQALDRMLEAEHQGRYRTYHCQGNHDARVHCKWLGHAAKVLHIAKANGSELLA